VSAAGGAAAAGGAVGAGGAGSEHVLAARAPFDAPALLAFLSHRAVPGVEEASPYRRSLRLAGGAGVATLSPADGGMRVALDLDDPRDEDEALVQLSALLDLDAPAEAIADVLGRDPVLGFTPGLRVPGGAGGEIAVRAVLTQQISVRAASTHAGRLVRAAGDPLARPRGTITHLFPTLEAVAAAPDAAFAMPARRRETLRALAGVPLDDLVSVPGIGRWTQSYVAMRALRDPDAWLPTDLGVRHALARLGTGADSDAWRPYRAYAVIHLWNTLGSSGMPLGRDSRNAAGGARVHHVRWGSCRS
jgi:AraC family transcriptional regulator of adaptative response / DNA-3-methyladenine glycosylase II